MNHLLAVLADLRENIDLSSEVADEVEYNQTVIDSLPVGDERKHNLIRRNLYLTDLVLQSR